MSMVFSGPSGVRTFQAISLKHGLKLYLATGIKPNRDWTPTNMLKTAGQITGNKYRPSREQYAKAIADLESWIAANGTSGEA